jgi:hypothetical protein
LARRQAKSRHCYDQLQMIRLAEESGPRSGTSMPLAIFMPALAPPTMAVTGDSRSLYNGADGAADDCPRRSGDDCADSCADSRACHMSFTSVRMLKRGGQSQHGCRNKHVSAPVHWKTPLFENDGTIHLAPAASATASEQNSSRFQRVQPQNRRKTCVKYGIIRFVAWCSEW